jgi:hypothetical protein
VSIGSSRWLAGTMLVFALTAAACGGSSTASPTVAPAGTPTAATATATATTAATSAPIATVAVTTASAACPTAATVNTALGTSLPEPVSVAASGASLPAGTVGVSCEYAGKTSNVLIEILTNTDPSIIASFSSKFPVAYTTVSGVGDQARAFTQSLGAGKDNEGVVATKGKTLVYIIATAAPATLAQLEALVSTLL